MDATREVSRELLSQLLEDACWAPTHGLTQPWRFHVFQSPAARARLGEGLTALYDSITPEAKRDADKRAKLAFGPNRAPVVIALSAAVEPGGKIPEWEEIAAVSCAAQNFMLSAHAHGLGTFWSTPPVACSAEFQAWLGLDSATHRGLGLLYIGWPLPSAANVATTRQPLASRVRWMEN